MSMMSMPTGVVSTTPVQLVRTPTMCLAFGVLGHWWRFQERRQLRTWRQKRHVWMSQELLVVSDHNVVTKSSKTVAVLGRWRETLHLLQVQAGVTLKNGLVAFVAIADRIVCADPLLWFGCFWEIWSLLASLLSPMLHGTARAVKPLELTWAVTHGLC